LRAESILVADDLAGAIYRISLQQMRAANRFLSRRAFARRGLALADEPAVLGDPVAWQENRWANAETCHALTRLCEKFLSRRNIGGGAGHPSAAISWTAFRGRHKRTHE